MPMTRGSGTRNAGHAVAGEHVVVVERAGPHPQHDVARPRHGVGMVRARRPSRRGPPCSREDEGAHQPLPPAPFQRGPRGRRRRRRCGARSERHRGRPRRARRQAARMARCSSWLSASVVHLDEFQPQVAVHRVVLALDQRQEALAPPRRRASCGSGGSAPPSGRCRASDVERVEHTRRPRRTPPSSTLGQRLLQRQRLQRVADLEDLPHLLGRRAWRRRRRDGARTRPTPRLPAGGGIRAPECG